MDSQIVYHGGLPLKETFKRSFEAKNNGSIGFYVTPNAKKAACYGPVHDYIFTPKKDLRTNHLTAFQAKKLSNLTHYWEAYGETAKNADHITEKLVNMNAHDALLEIINSTGQIETSINYIKKLDFTHATKENLPDEIIVIDIDSLKNI